MAHSLASLWPIELQLELLLGALGTSSPRLVGGETSRD